jgi:hypothetical protein
MIECVVIDAGARYGLHPTRPSLERIAEFDLFEMDQVAADRLSGVYSDRSNVRAYATALYEADAMHKFYEK